MTCLLSHNDTDTVSTYRFGANSTRRFGANARIDDQGYLHTGHSQRQPDRVVIACGPTGVRR